MARRVSSRSLALAVVTLAAAAGALASPLAERGPAPLVRSAAAQPGDARDASDVGGYLSRINALRASVGAPALELDAALSDLARRWAGHLADQGGLSHSPDLSAGITVPWAKLGENVGLGPDTASIFQAFVDSPEHHANLVDPTFTRVGIGVVWVGRIQYTTHRFLAPGEPAPPETAPPPPPREEPTPAPTSSTSSAPPTTATTVAPPPPAPPVVAAPPARAERIEAIVDALRAVPV